MWIHVLWLAALVLAVVIAYRTGIAVEAGRGEEEIEGVTAQLETARRNENLAIYERGQEFDRARALLDHEYQRSAGLRQMNEALLQALIDFDARRVPVIGLVGDIPDPPTIGQADEAVLEERRQAAQRADLQTREPVPISDDEAEPPPRVTEAVYGDG